MVMKRITIKDIAKSLELHHTTVSRALRNDNAINTDTKKRVLAYAKKHGYLINRNALQLRGDASNIIGVIVPNIHHNFFSNIISYITNYSFGKGYTVSVFQSNESVSQEKEILKAIVQNNIAGVVASLSMETTDASHFHKLKDYNIPLVLFDRIDNTLNVPTVTLNNVKALKQTVSLLVQKGRKRIAYLSGSAEVALYAQRQMGYIEGLKKNMLDYNLIIDSFDGFNIESGIKVTRELLQSSNVPDAIICDSHLLMQGVYSELKLQAKHIELATFGGYQGLSSVYPGVFFIQQPETEIAQTAFDLLISCMKNATADCSIHKKFEAKIIEN
jgi:LacI family transcriptional regulator